jgi:hypothetical protein
LSLRRFAGYPDLATFRRANEAFYSDSDADASVMRVRAIVRAGTKS